MAQITCINDAVIFEGRTNSKFCSTKCRVAYARKDKENTALLIEQINSSHDLQPDAPYGELKELDGKPVELKLATSREFMGNGVKQKQGSQASITPDVTAKSIDWREYEDPKSPHYIENPFDRPGDPTYDYEAELAQFKKIGLEEVEWITTGITDFDRLTMIPRGRLTQIEGRYSAGKTTLCLNMVRGLMAAKKKVLYIDTEASLNPVLLASLGLRNSSFDLYNKSAYLEDITTVMREAIKEAKYDLIVLDSLAMSTTKTVAESDITASNIGQKAKLFNKFLELIMGDLRDSKTALVIINQTRDKIGTYTPETYTPGGTGKDYNASLMISLKTIKSWRFGRTASDTKAKKFIGQEVEATIIKSKVNIPWRTAKFKLYYPQPRDEVETPF